MNDAVAGTSHQNRASHHLVTSHPTPHGEEARCCGRVMWLEKCPESRTIRVPSSAAVLEPVCDCICPHLAAQCHRSHFYLPPNLGTEDRTPLQIFDKVLLKVLHGSL